MNLLIDCGNTRLKWLCVGGEGQIIAEGSGASTTPETVLAHVLPVTHTLTSAIAAVVAGEQLKAALADTVFKMFGCKLEFAESEASFSGLHNGYDEPGRLGVDRWLAMVGAREVCSGSLLVADAGTALTLDAVADGRHLGGYIVPGYATQHRALGTYTASVRDGAGRPPVGGWGCSTEAAAANGIAMGLAGLIERAHVELQSRVADTCSLVLTGGDAMLLLPFLHIPAVCDQYVLFRGLWARRGSGTPLRHQSLTGYKS